MVRLDYSSSNPHQLDNVIDQISASQSTYQYNSSGSIKEIQDPMAGGPQKFYWIEEQWLSAVKNENGIHHYVYDHRGERIMKSTLLNSQVSVNDVLVGDVSNLDPYTLYVNPYYVVTSFQNGDKVSKHYFMNSQRVASEIEIIEDQVANIAKGGASDSTLTQAFVNNASVVDFNAALEKLGVSSRLEAPEKLPKIKEFYPDYDNSASTESAVYYKVMYWYHPDYIGNVDLVTDNNGEAYELFLYNAWGENMYDWESGSASFTSPYKFNGKEEDPETGFRYYGARYHHPRLSTWLSVDPLAHETLEPYMYTGNNPVMLVDPDGREVKWPWPKREKCPNDFGPDKKPRSARLNIKLPKIKWQTVKHTYVEIGDATTKRIATRRRLTRGVDIDNLQIDVRSKSNSTYTLRIVTGTKVPDDVRVNANGQDIVNTFPSPNPLITDDSGIDFSVPAGTTLDITSSKDPDSDKSFSQTRYDLYETTTSEEMTRTTKYRFLGIIPLPYKTKVSTYNTQRAIEKQKDSRPYRYRGRWRWI